MGLMRIEQPRDPYNRPQIDRRILEPLKVMAQRRLSPQVLQDLKAWQDWEPILGHMVLNLETHLYRHKDHVETRTVSVEKSEWVPIMQAYIPIILITWVMTIGMVVASVFEMIPPAAGVFSLLMGGVVVAAIGLLPQRLKVMVKGKAVFEKTQWSHFPDNQIILPPERLGQPIQVIEQKEWWREIDG